MKRLMIVALLFVAGAGPATKPSQPRLKDGAPDYARFYWDHAMAMKAANRDAMLRNLQSARVELQKKKAGRISTSMQPDEQHLPSGDRAFRSRDIKADKIKEAEKDVATAEARTRPDFIPTPELDYQDFKIGTAGMIGGTMLQVQDGTNALIQIKMYLRAGPGDWHETKPITLWLSGFPTKDMVDGARVDRVIVKISGSKQYESASGQSTVLLAEPFSIVDWVEMSSGK